MKSHHLATLLVVLLFCLGLSECPLGKIKAPPKIVSPIEIPEMEPSKIQIPVTVPTRDITKAILQEVRNPLVEDVTDEISIKLLATERITTEELIKELVTPYQPSYYKTIYEQVTQTVKEKYRCLLRPWKWGDCWRDVIRIVMVPNKILVPHVDAVYKWVPTEVIHITDMIFPTHGWVHYRVDLTGLDLKVHGGQVTAVADFMIHLKLDYEQSLVPLTPTIRLNGILSGDVEAKIEIKGDIAVSENAELMINIPDNGATITFPEVLFPGVVEFIDVVTILDPGLHLAESELGKLLSKRLRKEIQKAVGRQHDSLSFKDDIDKLVKKQSDARLIADDVWIIPDPSSVYLSPLVGEGNGADNKLTFSAGLICKPRVVYGKEKPEVDVPDEIAFSIQDIGDGVRLRVRGAVAQQDCALLLENELKELVDTKYAEYGHTIERVRVYPHEDRVVIAADLVNREKQKRLATFYLWGVPAYDSKEEEFYFTDVDFTAETKIKLIELAAWLLDQEILDFLEERARFPLGDEIKKVNDEIRSFEELTEYGRIVGGFEPVDISKVFVTKNDLEVLIYLYGNVVFEAAYASEELRLAEKAIPLSVLSRSVHLGRRSDYEAAILAVEKALNSAFAKIEDGRVDPLPDWPQGHLGASTAEGLRILIEKEAVKLTEIPISSPFVELGDTIYYEDETGEVKTRVAGLQDINVPGDEVLVMAPSGELEIMMMGD